jgi:hypothetical protein
MELYEASIVQCQNQQNGLFEVQYKISEPVPLDAITCMWQKSVYYSVHSKNWAHTELH